MGSVTLIFFLIPNRNLNTSINRKRGFKTPQEQTLHLQRVIKEKQRNSLAPHHSSAVW